MEASQISIKICAAPLAMELLDYSGGLPMISEVARGFSECGLWRRDTLGQRIPWSVSIHCDVADPRHRMIPTAALAAMR